MVLGSANYSLGPAFQPLYRQGKLQPTGTAKPGCSRLFSCHCDWNLQQNIISRFLKLRRNDVKVEEKKGTPMLVQKPLEKYGVSCQSWE